MRLEPEFMRELFWNGSRSLAIAIQPLSQIQRLGIRALYTFFRISRDTIDKAASKSESVSSIQCLVRMFETGDPDEAIEQIPDLGLAWEAWLGLEEEFSVPREYALEFVRGLQCEASGATIKTNEDLLRFCYQTGGVLGLVASTIVSAPEPAVQSFVDAGSAARLTSLANKVDSDFTLGRVYGAVPRFRQLAAVLYRSTREAFPLLPFRVRIAFSLALVLHRESESTFLRRADRVFDESIRQIIGTAWRNIRLSDFNEPSFAQPSQIRDANLALRNQTYRFSRDLVTKQRPQVLE